MLPATCNCARFQPTLPAHRSPYAAAFVRRPGSLRRDRERCRLASPPNCLILTSPAGNFARISSLPPIASIALRNVLTKMSERLSILDTPA